MDANEAPKRFNLNQKTKLEFFSKASNLIFKFIFFFRVLDCNCLSFFDFNFLFSHFSGLFRGHSEAILESNLHDI